MFCLMLKLSRALFKSRSRGNIYRRRISSSGRIHRTLIFSDFSRRLLEFRKCEFSANRGCRDLTGVWISEKKCIFCREIPLKSLGPAWASDKAEIMISVYVDAYHTCSCGHKAADLIRIFSAVSRSFFGSFRKAGAQKKVIEFALFHNIH